MSLCGRGVALVKRLPTPTPEMPGARTSPTTGKVRLLLLVAGMKGSSVRLTYGAHPSRCGISKSTKYIDGRDRGRRNFRWYTVAPVDDYWPVILIAVAVIVYVIAKVIFYMRKSERQWQQVDKTKLKEWEDDDD